MDADGFLQLSSLSRARVKSTAKTAVDSSKFHNNKEPWTLQLNLGTVTIWKLLKIFFQSVLGEKHWCPERG